MRKEQNAKFLQAKTWNWCTWVRKSLSYNKGLNLAHRCKFAFRLWIYLRLGDNLAKRQDSASRKLERLYNGCTFDANAQVREGTELGSKMLCLLCRKATRI